MRKEGTHPEVFAFKVGHFPVEAADGMQIGHEIIIIAEQSDALVQSRHNGGRVLAKLHRLVKLPALEVLEAVEEVEEVLVLFEEAVDGFGCLACERTSFRLAVARFGGDIRAREDSSLLT